MTTKFLSPDLDDSHRRNLRILADYLMALPYDYEHFDMFTYFSSPFAGDGSKRFLEDNPLKVSINYCGSVACALGHAPIALDIDLGVSNETEPGDPYSFWRRFSDLHLIPGGTLDMAGNVNWSAWRWCFASSWKDIDNTPYGAAQRIYTLLELGCPSDGFSQSMGNSKYRPSSSDYTTIAIDD